VFVTDWQIRGDQLVVGVLARFGPRGREVLVPDVGINPFIAVPGGFAALTYEGDLLVGDSVDIARPPKPGPAVCLACDHASGRLAVGGDRLVLLDPIGRELGVAAVPAEVHQVTFLGPDRLVTTDATMVYLWQYHDESLTIRASAVGLGGMSRLVGLPDYGLVIGASRHLSSTTMARVSEAAIQVLPPPSTLQGADVWLAPHGELIAVAGPFNAFLPPAPEQVEIFSTNALF